MDAWPRDLSPDPAKAVRCTRAAFAVWAHANIATFWLAAITGTPSAFHSIIDWVE